MSKIFDAVWAAFTMLVLICLWIEQDVAGVLMIAGVIAFFTLVTFHKQVIKMVDDVNSIIEIGHDRLSLTGLAYGSDGRFHINMHASATPASVRDPKTGRFTKKPVAAWPVEIELPNRTVLLTTENDTAGPFMATEFVTQGRGKPPLAWKE